MRLNRAFWGGAIGLACFGATVFAADPLPADTIVVATPAVYVPDSTHANDPLPDGVLAWDELSKSTDVTGNVAVHFFFNFTNIAEKVVLGQMAQVTSITNFTVVTNSSFWARLRGRTATRIPNIINFTNIITVTNSITPIPVTLLSVRPSCGCTTAQLPPLPWTLLPGTNGQINLSVNIEGRMGPQTKTVTVSTDKGYKVLTLHINILPEVMPQLTEQERARDLEIAKTNRQAVFQNDCANCHLKNFQGKYGKPLYDAVCGICHETQQRAAVVPDLQHLKVPTNEEFWRTWIAHGKPGSLMPAFATSEGGPLNDLQISTLAAYLNATFKPQIPNN